jgi:hypothetical protein
MVIQYDRGTNTSSAKRIDMADAVGGRLPEGHGSANPRGLAAEDGRSLAARLPRLDGARVLLVDNGKLTASYGPYDAIADALAALFPAATWIPVSLDLLRYDHTQIARIAGDLIATHAPDASVLALGDTGVSLQTTLLAALFEGSGVPSVVLATLLGERVCRPVAQSQAPGLPIIAFNTERTDTQAMVRDFITSDVHVAVAGTPGPQSMVALPWGYSRGQWQIIAAN